jgi:hypothetical protein
MSFSLCFKPLIFPVFLPEVQPLSFCTADLKFLCVISF